MKNAMKKIMSLVLVAMIMVSALPFAASADSGEMCNFWIELKLDGNHVDSQMVSVPVGTTMDEAAVKQYAATIYGEYFGAGYEYAGCYAFGGAAGVDGYIGAGIQFTTKVVETEPAETEPAETEPAEPEMVNFWIELNVDGKHVDSQIVSVPMGTVMDEGTVKLYAEKHLYGKYFGNGYSYEGCYDFGGKAGVNGYIGAGIKFATKSTATTPNTPNNGTSTDATGYYKLSGDVVLEICVGQNQNPAKTISIKSGIAADGRVNLDEVKSVVKYYYNAVEADDGIKYDGLYLGQTYASNVIEWVNDSKVNSVDGLYDAANNCKLVTIRVYISNATASSTSGKADSTNPKTGDELYKAVTVMSISASALAVAFYFNKKRTIA